MTEHYENGPVGPSDDPFDQPHPTDDAPYAPFDEPEVPDDRLVVPAAEPMPQYFPVSKLKFIAMAVLTFGIYEIYWFYRNWAFVRDRDSVRIRPFWRAVFGPLWLHALIGDINQARGEGGIPKGQAIGLFVGYIVISGLWRLPDPYWLVSCLSFLPLLPVLWQIAFLNRDCPQALHGNSTWGPRHWVLTATAGPLVLFVFISTLNVIPNTQVVSGSKMWQRDVEFLRSAGLLEENEEILYFYSQDLFDMKNDGNLLTDRKAVSYWQDSESDEFLAEIARYEEIASIDTDYSESFVDDTIITVHRYDGSSFILVVSAEEGRDHLFVDELQSRVW
jgi:hypothetical protein